MTNKIVSLEIDDEALDAIAELVHNATSNDDTTLCGLKAMRLLVALKRAYDITFPNADAEIPKKKMTLKQEIKVLHNVIERQKWTISGLMVKNMLTNQISGISGANMSTIVQDMLFDPEPVIIHCSMGQHSEDLPIRIRNIYAVKNERNSKKIYLKNPITKHDGKEQYFVDTTMEFDELLWTLQRDEKIIMRATRSIAVNIFEYTFENTSGFKMIDRKEDKLFEFIKKVKPDSMFDTEEYRKIVLRIDEYIKGRNSFYANTKKMEKIASYIRELGP